MALAGDGTGRIVTMRYDRSIEKVPGVQGGEPVIKGTRTPVRTVA
ncbi:MAG: DUF433 domain-containing protein [Chloroflexota bacterium]